jgi:hypothetical protein
MVHLANDLVKGPDATEPDNGEGNDKISGLCSGRGSGCAWHGVVGQAYADGPNRQVTLINRSHRAIPSFTFQYPGKDLGGRYSWTYCAAARSVRRHQPERRDRAMPVRLQDGYQRWHYRLSPWDQHLRNIELHDYRLTDDRRENLPLLPDASGAIDQAEARAATFCRPRGMTTAT